MSKLGMFSDLPMLYGLGGNVFLICTGDLSVSRWKGLASWIGLTASPTARLREQSRCPSRVISHSCMYIKKTVVSGPVKVCGANLSCTLADDCYGWLYDLLEVLNTINDLRLDRVTR